VCPRQDLSEKEYLKMVFRAVNPKGGFLWKRMSTSAITPAQHIFFYAVVIVIRAMAEGLDVILPPSNRELLEIYEIESVQRKPADAPTDKDVEAGVVRMIHTRMGP
jgi:hypothetical protein